MRLINALVARTFALTRVQNPQFTTRRWLHANEWRYTDNRWRLCFGQRPHAFDRDDLREDFDHA